MHYIIIMTTRQNSIIQVLVNKAVKFNKMAKAFKAQGELEGSLINFLLAIDNLKTARDQSQAIAQNILSSGRGDDVSLLCEKNCDKIDEVLKQLAQEIAPLQEELKKRKMFRASSSSDESDPVLNCTDVSQVIIQGKECVFFDDIVGHDTVKNNLKEMFIFPISYPNLYPKKSRGILLYGPPGTGKTLIAKAAAVELQFADPGIGVLFYAPTPDKLKGKFVGDTEKNIARVFDCAAQKAMECQNNPNNEGKKFISIVFLDEIDSIATARTSGPNDSSTTSSVNILLQKMQGISELDNVVVIGGTNFPQKIDPAVMSRFEQRIHVRLPTDKDILKILENEIDNYLKLDAREFQNGNTVRFTRKTTRSQNVCGTLCDKTERETLYLRPSYKRFIPIEKEDLIAIVDVLSQNPKIRSRVSQRDIVSWVRRSLTNVAVRARNKGRFIRVNELTDFRRKPIPGEIYMSVNVIDALEHLGRTEDANFVRKQMEISDAFPLGRVRKFINIPEMIGIRIDGEQFTHRLATDDFNAIELPFKEAYINATRNKILFMKDIRVELQGQDSEAPTITSIMIRTKEVSLPELLRVMENAVAAAEKKSQTFQQRIANLVSRNAAPSEIDKETTIIKYLIENDLIDSMIEWNPFKISWESAEFGSLSEVGKRFLINNNEKIVLNNRRSFLSENAGLSSVEPDIETISLEDIENVNEIGQLKNLANRFEIKKRLISWDIRANDFQLEELEPSVTMENIQELDNFDAPSQKISGLFESRLDDDLDIPRIS